jgi:hypothetical protein
MLTILFFIFFLYLHGHMSMLDSTRTQNFFVNILFFQQMLILFVLSITSVYTHPAPPINKGTVDAQSNGLTLNLEGCPNRYIPRKVSEDTDNDEKSLDDINLDMLIVKTLSEGDWFRKSDDQDTDNHIGSIKPSAKTTAALSQIKSDLSTSSDSYRHAASSPFQPNVHNEQRTGIVLSKDELRIEGATTVVETLRKVPNEHYPGMLLQI